MEAHKLKEILEKHTLWLQGGVGERADLGGANLREADLRGADLEGASLLGVYLRKASLTGADLREADLKWTEWGGADLRGADLRGADLRGADLRGASLRETEVISFSLGKDFGFFHKSPAYPKGNHLQIGCEGHPLSHWLEFGRELGEKAGYTPEEIELYIAQIEMLAKNNFLSPYLGLPT